jgi:hypothetical protein
MAARCLLKVEMGTKLRLLSILLHLIHGGHLLRIKAQGDDLVRQCREQSSNGRRKHRREEDGLTEEQLVGMPGCVVFYCLLYWSSNHRWLKKLGSSITCRTINRDI